MMEQPETRKLKINMSELEHAFNCASWEMSFYLDLETGEVPFVPDQIRQDVEQIYQEIEDAGDAEREAAFHEAIERSDLPEREKEAVLEAGEIELFYEARYLPLPPADPRDGYRDTERFIESVEDETPKDRLWRAIDGRGAFRRFNDELDCHDEERQRWFAFRDALVCQRVLGWQ